jgi:hypothetical protein
MLLGRKGGHLLSFRTWLRRTSDDLAHGPQIRKASVHANRAERCAALPGIGKFLDALAADGCSPSDVDGRCARRFDRVRGERRRIFHGLSASSRRAPSQERGLKANSF